MKKYNCILFVVAAFMAFSGCNEQVYPDIDKPDPNRQNINQVLSFALDLSQFSDYKAGDAIITDINAAKDSISVFVPWYVGQLLRPQLTVSDNATLSPISGSIQDFSQAVTYTVRAENGEKKDWKVYMNWIEEPEPPRADNPRRPLEADHPKYPLVKISTWGNTYSTGTGASRTSANPHGYITNTANPATEAIVQTIYFVVHHEGELQMALRGLTSSSSTGNGNTINVRAFINGVQAKDDDGVTDYNHDYQYRRTSANDTIVLHRIAIPELPAGQTGHQVKLEIRGKNARVGNYYYRFYELWLSGWATRGDKGAYYDDKRTGVSFSYSSYSGDGYRDGIAAPSIHMNMNAPDGNMEYFYTEVTVPEGGDALGTYFMTSGNAQGYAGIQTNSATERRFLFSVWAAIEESDPSALRAKYNPKLVRLCDQALYRKNITYAVFGGEGTGGQSYLNVRWETGKTYKVLLRIRPHPDQTRFPNSTLYKAWYHNGTEWLFMCEWRRQEVQPGDKGVTVAKGPYWYTSASHFVEDFNGTRGNLFHAAYYSNHWFITDRGVYVEPTGYTFTGDQAYGRADVAGGVVKDGPFANAIFLKSGGYFTDAETLPNPFKKFSPAVKPDLDLAALNAMGTDDPTVDKSVSGSTTSPLDGSEKYTE